MKKSKQNDFNKKDFQTFTKSVTNTLDNNVGLIGDQKTQVELLFELEKKFKFHIQKYQQCVEIYKKFIKKFEKDSEDTEDGENILSAQPYFREKSENLSKIFKAIKEKDHVLLMTFNINYQMINFIAKNWRGNIPERARRYYDDFLEARRILVENNIPLAINHAKIFYKKTPQSHLDLLDLIDISIYGLIVGIDKYEGAYSKSWVSTCLGRMSGFMIEDYNKTFLRMFPSDRKILYRANALKYRMKIEDIKELTNAVNESFKSDKEKGMGCPKLPITELHIQTLLNGSSYVSADPSTDEQSEKNPGNIYNLSTNVDDNKEEELIKNDLMDKIYKNSSILTSIEKKILRLKGVNL